VWSEKHIWGYEMLVANQISANYGKLQVLFKASLIVSEGDKILLVGPNGAGKSTFFKVITGLLSHSSGDVFFQGDRISSWPTHKIINAGIGCLIQTGNIVPGLTVGENLKLGCSNLKPQVIKSGIDELVANFPFLSAKYASRAGFLSGGERQTLALSMILIKKPNILLLDEPTAGLSPKAASTLLSNIEKVQDFSNVKAVCMVEHNLKLSLPWANKVAVMVRGSVVQVSETPEHYLENPKELESMFFK
jgi:branched-chain amino acid transport system ATP-binding protein